MNNAEKVRRMMRARIHIQTRFDVEFVPPNKEKLTCRECGESEVQFIGGREGISSDLAERMVKYRAQGGGITGECKHCTKRERDRRYPAGWGPLGPQSEH